MKQTGETHSMVCLSQTVDFFGVLGFPYHAIISIRNVHASLSLVKQRTTNCETIIPEKNMKKTQVYSCSMNTGILCIIMTVYTGEQSSARYCHCLRALVQLRRQLACFIQHLIGASFVALHVLHALFNGK